MGWIVGLDPGSKRIGVAVADATTRVATPLTVWDAKAWPDRLAELCAEREVELIIVGLPVSLSGIEGPAAVRAREFASEVESTTEAEVELFDERFTSAIAETALIESGAKRRTRKEVRDKLAAAVMLQSYLNSIP